MTRYAPRWLATCLPVLTAFSASLLLAACTETATEPTHQDLSISEARLPRVEVCHLTKKGWSLRKVTESSAPRHLAHGDGVPGGDVPGMVGYQFDESCVVSVGTPLAPVVSSVDSPTQASLTVNWNDVSGEGRYEVQYKASFSGTWLTGSTNVAANSTSYTQTGLAASTSYDFRVGACLTGASPECSAYSNTGTGTTSSGGSDSQPPELITNSISPTTIDVSARPGTVSVQAQFTDGLSGVERGSAQFLSPSGGQITSNFNLSRISGDQFDGVYEGSTEIPQNAEAGTWTLTKLNGLDYAGNLRNFASELEGLGLPFELEVVSAGGG